MDLIQQRTILYSPARVLSDQLQAQNYPLVELPRRPDNLHVWYMSNEQSGYAEFRARRGCKISLHLKIWSCDQVC